MKKISLVVMAIVMALSVMFHSAYAEDKASDNNSDNQTRKEIAGTITFDDNSINYNFYNKIVDKKGVSLAKTYRWSERMEDPAVVKKIMAVKGVESFTLNNYSIVVVKGELFTEEDIMEKVSPIILKYYFPGKNNFIITGLTASEQAWDDYYPRYYDQRYYYYNSCDKNPDRFKNLHRHKFRKRFENNK